MEAARKTDDLWGPTISCPDCQGAVAWEDWDAHVCAGRTRWIEAQIADLEARLVALYALRARGKAPA